MGIQEGQIMEKTVIRVLHVIHSLGCGGAEMMIMNLYRHIDRTEIQFDFMVHSEEEGFFEKEVEAYGGRVFRVSYFNGINCRQYRAEVRQLFTEHPEIKVVHGHLGSCAHIYLNEAKKVGMFTIAHSHNTNSHDFSLKAIAYRVFTFKTRRVADYFFACSQKAGEDRFGKKIVGDNRKYVVFNNAIDCQKYMYDENVRGILKDELGIKEKYVIGHIGRFNEQKNHEYLIDIFAEYHKSNKDSVLVLVGDGDLRATIKEKVTRLNIDECVMFLGVRDDVNRLLQAFDCIVFPSKYEGLPVTLIEAQASGVPCVISDGITDEVMVTNLITKVSLSNNLDEWVKAIGNCRGIIRGDHQTDLKEKGYDIHDTTRWLEKFYLEHVSDRGNQ